MPQRTKSEATTYRVVKLGDEYKRVFSEQEWTTLSPDDQAQYETIKVGIGTKQEAEAELGPAPRPPAARTRKPPRRT